MPELPDILLYLHALSPRVVGHAIERVRIKSPFVVRTFDPPIEACEGKKVIALSRIGKRIVFEIESDLFLVVHLMIAGRFRWDDRRDAKLPGKIGLASFHFDTGTLHLVESSPKKRASIHLLSGVAALAALNRGGKSLFAISIENFAQALRKENHTIKRVLTDPHIFDGIGNAYSDEILHAAKLSPIKLSQKLSDEEIARLFAAAKSILKTWTERLQNQFANKFPGAGDVTAFRPGFAVHGKFGKPCPVCGTIVQRIRYADNETNYCPRCQTEGRILADRSLSRLLKSDWPKSIEELESQ